MKEFEEVTITTEKAKAIIEELKKIEISTTTCTDTTGYGFADVDESIVKIAELLDLLDTTLATAMHFAKSALDELVDGRRKGS